MSDDFRIRPALLVVSALGWLGLIALVVTCSRSEGGSAFEVAAGMANAAGYYMPSRSPASLTPPEALKAEPAYTGTPYYGSYRIGDGSDPVYTYVLDVPPGGDVRFWLDANNNEDLTDDGDGSWASANERTFMTRRDLEVSWADGQTATARFMFYFFRGEDPTVRGVLYARDWARVGRVRLGGQDYQVGIIENDNDGIFRLTDAEGKVDPRAVSFSIDLNGDGRLDSGSDSAEHYRSDEPFNAGGESYLLASVSPAGDRVTFRVSETKVEPKLFIEVGYEAPAFEGSDQEGRDVSLAAFLKEHKVVLLDFWATWCGPCIAELPNVQATFERHRGEGFGVLGVSLDADPAGEPGEASRTRAQVAAFMRENGMDWPSIYDGKFWSAEVGQRYRVSAIPATFLLDADGVIRYTDLRGEDLEKAVIELLAK
jgi:thiol-disulfide isomerase/thioredoxin